MLKFGTFSRICSLSCLAGVTSGVDCGCSWKSLECSSGEGPRAFLSPTTSHPHGSNIQRLQAQKIGINRTRLKIKFECSCHQTYITKYITGPHPSSIVFIFSGKCPTVDVILVGLFAFCFVRSNVRSDLLQSFECD